MVLSCFAQEGNLRQLVRLIPGCLKAMHRSDTGVTNHRRPARLVFGTGISGKTEGRLRFLLLGGSNSIFTMLESKLSGIIKLI